MQQVKHIDLQKLKAFRKKAKLTQFEVAQALGYKTTLGYHYIETGRSNLRAEQVSILSELYGEPFENFFAQ